MGHSSPEVWLGSQVPQRGLSFPKGFPVIASHSAAQAWSAGSGRVTPRLRQWRQDNKAIVWAGKDGVDVPALLYLPATLLREPCTC